MNEKSEKIIDIVVKLKTSGEGIEPLPTGVLNIKINIPPVLTKSNPKVCEMVADYFGVEISDVKVIDGFQSQNKQLLLSI